jgi:glycosyltransferase involved in cell wall biosynthesis
VHLRTFLKSIATGIVRNCADIIAFSVLHHILLGVDQCIVIDNGSTDGTLELLSVIAKKLPKLCVISDPSPFQQAEIVGAVINEYTRAAKTIVIPFDCDEFWDAPVAKLAAYFGRKAVNILECEVLNFVQSRRVTRPSRFSWMRASRRASAVAGLAPTLVRDHTISFVEVEYPRKVLFHTEGSVVHANGAHSIDFAGSHTELCNKFVCFHFPLRSRQELSKRAYDHEPRIAPFRKEGASWQNVYFCEALDRNMLNAEWSANSFDHRGRIDVYGTQRRMRRDARLVLRLLSAYAYGLYLKIPMQPS